MATNDGTRSASEWQGDTMHSETEAHGMRLALAAHHMYPTRPMTAEHDAAYEDGIREVLLPEALERLNRDDLVCIFWLIRLLATHAPRATFYQERSALERAEIEALVNAGKLPAAILGML